MLLELFHFFQKQIVYPLYRLGKLTTQWFLWIIDIERVRHVFQNQINMQLSVYKFLQNKAQFSRKSSQYKQKSYTITKWTQFRMSAAKFAKFFDSSVFPWLDF